MQQRVLLLLLVEAVVSKKQTASIFTV